MVKVMLRLIKEVFFPLSSSSGSLTTKSVVLNNEPCMTKTTLTGLNPVELHYHPLTIRVR